MNYFKGSGGCGVISSPKYYKVVEDLSVNMKTMNTSSESKNAIKNKT